MRPTDQAIEAFGRATNTALLAHTTKDSAKLALAVNALSGGLIHLATGLKATYILLNEVKGQLQRQNS